MYYDTVQNLNVTVNIPKFNQEFILAMAVYLNMLIY